MFRFLLLSYFLITHQFIFTCGSINSPLLSCRCLWCESATSQELKFNSSPIKYRLASPHTCKQIISWKFCCMTSEIGCIYSVHLIFSGESDCYITNSISLRHRLEMPYENVLVGIPVRTLFLSLINKRVGKHVYILYASLFLSWVSLGNLQSFHNSQKAHPVTLTEFLIHKSTGDNPVGAVSDH